MNINSRYPVRHKLLLAGSGERAAVTLTRVAGYRRSPRGRQRRPIIRSNTHAPDQTDTQPRLLQCLGRPRRPGPVVILPLSDFHEVSRAAGPKGQTPKTPRQPSRSFRPRVLSRLAQPNSKPSYSCSTISHLFLGFETDSVSFVRNAILIV